MTTETTTRDSWHLVNKVAKELDWEVGTVLVVVAGHAGLFATKYPPSPALFAEKLTGVVERFGFPADLMVHALCFVIDALEQTFQVDPAQIPAGYQFFEEYLQDVVHATRELEQAALEPVRNVADQRRQAEALMAVAAQQVRPQVTYPQGTQRPLEPVNPAILRYHYDAAWLTKAEELLAAKAPVSGVGWGLAIIRSHFPGQGMNEDIYVDIVNHKTGPQVDAYMLFNGQCVHSADPTTNLRQTFVFTHNDHCYEISPA